MGAQRSLDVCIWPKDKHWDSIGMCDGNESSTVGTATSLRAHPTLYLPGYIHRIQTTTRWATYVIKKSTIVTWTNQLSPVERNSYFNRPYKHSKLYLLLLRCILSMRYILSTAALQDVRFLLHQTKVYVLQDPAFYIDHLQESQPKQDLYTSSFQI